MKVQKFNSEEEWLEARRGRITGTKVKELYGERDGKPKAGWYKIIAERVALPPNGENVMDRGHRLEEVALELFAQRTGKKVKNDLVMWFKDDEENICSSPDGTMGVTEAAEVKCLASEKHIEAFLNRTIPTEYKPQAVQYFITNEKLKKLYFLFFDPRMPIDLFWIEFTREDVQDDIEFYLNLERRALREIAEAEKLFTF